MNFKYIIWFTVGLVVISLFYFPVTFAAFPVSNTKNLMAALGLAVIVMEMLLKQQLCLDKEIFVTGLFAGAVSVMGLFSVAYNETPDYAYATYLGSFFLWMFSAYFVVYVIRKIHGYASVRLVCDYLILMCVLQCVSVLLIDTYPGVKGWVNATFTEFSEIDSINRMYGIGPALDVAGSRFAVVSLLIAHILTLDKVVKNAKVMYMYIFALLFIQIVGSMVGRTTSVGGGMALLYLLWFNRAILFSSNHRKFLIGFILVVVAAIYLSVYYYNNNLFFRENIRFAFEGFFNWWEHGEWKTTSTDRWQTMLIWPDNLKTWLMGDGYFVGPSESDPYYVGPFNPGFYKWTDVGYLRFIFYFGIIGLILFIMYFFKVVSVCISRFREYKNMFLYLLLFNFVLWFKVSTDIFLVFALFLCIPKVENEKVLSERTVIHDN